MKIGVLWKSNKENERRYPIHSKHINELRDDELENIFFEDGYPIHRDLNCNIRSLSRQEIFNTCDMIILPKPDPSDFPCFRPHQILWGWPHTVQGHDITNLAIEKKLTLIAWENMHNWSMGVRKEHIFARNNELAGYAAVNHFMELNGITPGVYGEEIKIAVLGYGSTAKGAINALIGLGGTDITVFSKRSKFQIIDAIKNIKYKTYSFYKKEVYIENDLAYKELVNYDLIVNCVLQDPLNPMIFIRADNINYKQLSIIDISCDKGMSFDFALPTSFESPIITNDKYVYYAVDHTPSYFFNSASYEISGSLLPFLKYILKNDSYKGNEILERAVDIEDGVVTNKAILKFQNREDKYPYEIAKIK